MANPDQFANRIRRIAVGVVDGAVNNVRNTALVAIRTVTRFTPKDTTLARSNWLANIGSPDLSERPIRPASEVVAEARTSLDRGRIRAAILSRNSVEIHIANGGDKVPYLATLDRGSSKQAPAGFVKMALQESGAKTLVKARLLRGRKSEAVGV